MKILAIFLSSSLLLPQLIFGQTLNELLAISKNSDRVIQAIHNYPKDIENGNCHWVPVSLIEVNGNKIKIVESWKSPFGKAETVLTGTVQNGIATGTWSSTFSSGTWSYNFTNASGQWNKTKTISRLKTFSAYQPLRFRIVARGNLRDGEYDCN